MPKIFYGWWVTAAASIGLSTSPGQFAFGALGLFILPLSQEFGWSRAQISIALTVFTLALAVTSPFIGKLVDRLGSKQVLIPSLFIFACLLFSISVFVAKLWHLYVIFLMIGVLAAGANGVAYMHIIGVWFNRRRGLALGFAMAGGGFGYTYVPPMLQYLIDHYGWRFGYYALAAIVLFIALPICALILKNNPTEMGLSADGDSEEGASKTITPAIITLKELLSNNSFRLLYVIFALLSMCLYGLMPHLVPMLVDRGMEGATAALVASTVGMTIIVSRAGIGYLLDRFFAPRVAMFCVLLSTIGIILFASGGLGFSVYIAAVLLGVSIGAEFDLLAYLTTRYFGLGSFGMTYGLLFSAFLIGTAVGPVMYGGAFDHYGSYIGILYLSSIILLITAGLLLLLPKYKRE